MATNNETNGGSNITNGTPSRNFSMNKISGTGSNRDYDSMKQQMTAIDHSPRRRCEHSHTVSDLDYYNQHRTMEQLDSTAMRTHFLELQSENQRLEQENQRLRQKFNDQEMLFLSHPQSLGKFEQSQEESNRLVKQIEVITQEKASLMQQMSNMYKDLLKCREAHQKTLQLREDEEKQLKLLKTKAAKDVKRLMDERNATMAEYSLVMSERDQVHKEMERLADDLSQALKKNKQLEQDKKQLLDESKSLRYQAEGLRREIASALHERDRALKECGELRNKFGEPGEGLNMAQSRLFDSLTALGGGGTRKEHQSDQRTGQRQRLENLDQANQELESLRKNLDKAQSELSEAIQEAEVSKGRRDWAFSERDKIVQERESIRTLCDNMRKERDRAVSELAESLRESDGFKKQKMELQKEVAILKELLENQEQQTQNSWHEDVVEVDMQLDGLDVGVELVGGREDSGGDGGVYVASVAPLSPADGKLRQNDRILRVNDMDCTSASRRIVLEAMRSGVPSTRMLIKRKNQWNSLPSNVTSSTSHPSHSASSQTGRWVHTARLASACHGLSLKYGVYIERISRGSLAAQDSSLAVGDRVLKINEKSIEELGGIHEAMRALNCDSLDIITVTVLKTGIVYNNPNVFMPVRRYKKENRSSQTDEGLYDHRRYPNNSSMSEYKNNSSAWIKDKLDTVLRGRHRHFKDEKKKYRNSSPHPSDNQEHEEAIAELDMVIDSYHGTAKKPNHRRYSAAAKEECKNGGTWPKARAVAFLDPETATGTVVARKRERPALSLLATKEGDYCCQVGAAANAAKRNSTPISILNDRHQEFKSLDGRVAVSGDSLEKLRTSNQRLSMTMNSDNSLDFSVPKYNDPIAMASPYYSRIKSSIAGSKYGSDSEREETTSVHSRIHSQLFGGSRIPYPFHPHPHPHLDHSRESFSFEPSYMHNSGDLHESAIGTFPRKQRDPPRFRVPSNPSVTGSVERGSSDRGSPMPIFHVEVLPGELRRVHIEKSNEPLGIQINCLQGGGIFVSTVSDNSLASQVGLQIGDQLLEVCGINMRNATYNLAASVLRQCGNSITMLVQYSPDKYHEVEGSGSCSGDSSCNEEEDENETTPCNSPKEIRKSALVSGGLLRNAHTPISLPIRQSAHRTSNGLEEPRYLYMDTMKTSNLGISLVGGNASGIFIHSVQPDSVAYRAGLRTGDQILEYNGSDLRAATAEEAAYELAKPADKVTVLAHYRIDRYHEIKDKPGDSLYVRCGFDRAGDEHTEPPQLQFNRDDVLYVDNTMFNGVPGQWRAWRLDADGHRQHCGVVPSKYKVEEELLLRRSAAELESRSPSNTSSARRSFFRRKKHHQRAMGHGSNGSSRDSKELASFSSLAPG
ncbi:disks large homolog 5 isoform X2 [Coccinella septempunctata]|nr:disks large homolog 5 isoform X2 [Coccinella septempunctata]